MSHKAKRAFATDKQLAQIISRGVFDHTAIELQDITFTSDHRQPHDPLTGHAIAYNFNTAGIGADIATHLARAGRGKVDRVVEVFRFGKVLQLLSDHTGFNLNQTIGRIKLSDTVHFIHTDDNFAIGRDCASRQTSTTTTWRYHDIIFIGKQYDGLYLLGGLWKDDSSSSRSEVLGPVFAPML